jgi:glycosyltransferase involved in cell wall biosynthesis
MGPPRISIVTPSFNQAEYLGECLHSVLEQDYPNLEYLVIDGGSTDGSLDILRGVGNRLAFWASGPDRGQAEAVNKGWARATGEVLGWINSDDLLRPGTLARVSAAYAAHPSAALLFGDVEEVNASGLVVRTKNMAGFGLHSLLLGKNMPQPGVFISRRTYTTLGGLDESLHYALDFDYFLRAWLAFPAEDCLYVPGVLAASRVWPRTKTNQAGPRIGVEYRKVLDATFARTDLPVEIQELKTCAYSRAFLFKQARIYFGAGDRLRGLFWLARSVFLEPFWTEKAHMGRYGLRCLLAGEWGEA